MVTSEKIIRRDGDEYEYKYVLTLICNSDVIWRSEIFKREKNSVDLKKNQKNFGWKPHFGFFPKDCEIVFSKMKDDIIERLIFDFDKSMIELKIENDELRTLINTSYAN